MTRLRLHGRMETEKNETTSKTQHNLCRAAKLSLLNFLSLFRDLQKPTRFGGGGGSSRIFP